MSNALAVLRDSQTEFVSIAKAVKWKEEFQFAVQALQKNTMLGKCSPDSLRNSIINVAAVGLTLNPADGYAYLIPEKGECSLRISYKGLIKIATDSGCIKWVRAEIVKENDIFTYKGVDEKPVHEMQPFSDRGKSVGVYCVAKTNDDEYLCDVMSWEDVQKIRSCAKFDAVWFKWEDEQAKKSIINRASKQWPKSSASSELHKAIEVINESESVSQEMQVNMTVKELVEKIDSATNVTELNQTYFHLRKLDDVTDADIKRFSVKKKELEALEHGTEK